MKKDTVYNKSEELNTILNDAMQNLKYAIDVNTIVGKPIISDDGTTIIPVSKVYVGMVSGGGELCSTNTKNDFSNYPFAGGMGTGFTVSPIGFLITKNNATTFINTEIDKSSEKLVEMINRTLKIVLENLKKE